MSAVPAAFAAIDATQPVRAPGAPTSDSRPLSVLIVHNAYQHRGGEDAVVDAEARLLRAHGHTVTLHLRHNDEVTATAAWQLAADSIWSRRSHAALCELIARDRPDVVHVHNTLPLVSASIYDACRQSGVPVVQTLHNFRLACPQGMFLREQRVCEDCLGQLPWPALRHGCYRGSRVQTAGVIASMSVHRALGVRRDRVSRYIALNQFGRKKFIEGGLPAGRIVVKPNFVDDPGVIRSGPREGFAYVGRLATEKGLDVLSSSLRVIPEVNLYVAGTGPMADSIAHQAGVTMLGHLDRQAVLDLMRRVRAVVVPSICYETFGLVIVEAFACGTPVIASRLGSMAELVEDGVTGRLFQPSDADDLARQLTWAQARPDRMLEMGQRARQVFESEYTAKHNYNRLMAIYRDAMASCRTSLRQSA